MARPSPSLVKHPVPPVQPTQSITQNTVATGAQFIPRREFIRDHRVVSSFALLALSGSGYVRLYSFSQPVISALKTLFDQHNLILAVHERAPHHFFEFSLEGKPWAKPKTITSEKLLIDILSRIFYCGYSFLSTIDYGREPDDKLAIAFSKQMVPNSAFPLSNGSAVSLNPPVHKSVFAISFSSATELRVVGVGPPLASTPAVLQAVRGAWPRGVVQEKKVGDSTYEFTLKGYKWFQEDTFATDSLHHILGLLSALDSHGFRLLTSLSLTNRSRVKDMWIFTGEEMEPVVSEAPLPSPTASNSDVRRDFPLPAHQSVAPGPSPLSIGAERRSLPRQMATPANDGSTGDTLAGHSRQASDPTPTSTSPPKSRVTPFSKVHNALRKSPPKTQIPVGFIPDFPAAPAQYSNGSAANPPPSSQFGRTSSFSPKPLMRSLSNPSSIGSVDMTGIGSGRRRMSMDARRTPDVFYSTDVRRNNPYFPPVKAYAEPPHAAFIQGHERHRSEEDRSRADSSRPSLGASNTSRSSTQLLQRDSPSSLNPQIQVQAPSPIVATNSRHLLAGGEPSMPSGRRDERYASKHHVSRTPTPPLLTPGTFRDSAFSSATGFHSEVVYRESEPLVSAATEQQRTRRDDRDRDDRPPLHLGAGKTDAMERTSTGAGLPPPAAREESQRHDAGYKAFPPTIRELPSQEGDGHSPTKSKQPPNRHTPTHTQKGHEPQTRAPHDRRSRSPEPHYSASYARGSRMPQTMLNGRDSTTSAGPDKVHAPKPTSGRRDTAMSGWVMVNIETPAGDKSKSSSTSPSPGPRPTIHQRRSNSDSRIHQTRSPVGAAPALASMSAAAKTIAMIDAVDAREQERAPSGLKKLFHRSKGSDGEAKLATPKKRAPEGGITKHQSMEVEEREERMGMRDKLRIRSHDTPTVVRPSEQRVAID